MARCVPDGLLRQGERSLDQHAREAGVVMLGFGLYRRERRRARQLRRGLFLVQRPIETTCVAL